MRRALLLSILTTIVALAGCTSQPPDGSDPPVADVLASTAPGVNPLVTIETSLGTFQAEIFLEEAPVTARNFLDLAGEGFYDGILFHRVIGPGKSPPAGFMVQTGDPLTRDASARDRWGTGGSEETIPDEFHAGLRHGEAGTLSMANSGPNSGSSQFFITLAATPWLDDKHAVFGKVVRNYDVVRSIGAVETDGRDRPLDPVSIVGIDILDPNPEASRNVKLKTGSPDFTQPAMAGRPAPMTIVVTNQGNVRANVSLAIEAPAGWASAVEAGFGTFVVPAGASRAVSATATPPAGAANGTAQVRIVASAAGHPNASSSSTFSLRLTSFGAVIQNSEQTIRANYIGFLSDGRIFDTSLSEVASNADLPKYERVFTPRDSYAPLTFTTEGGVIQGMREGVQGVREGETVILRIPPAKAYGETIPDPCRVAQPPPACSGPLEFAGRELIFQVEIVSVG